MSGLSFLQTVCQSINNLVQYGIDQGLCTDADRFYVRHRLMALLKMDTWFEPSDQPKPIALGDVQETLNDLLAYAIERQLLPNDGITQKDLFDTALMDCLLPMPSVIQSQFKHNYATSPERATQRYYDQSRASNYIRTARIAKNLTWKYPSEFGQLDITINLSRPEKDPKAIIAEGAVASEKYPKCLLCRENEGYAGRVDHPARQNLRLIPLTLNHEDWFLQYSPYEYYNEHCIVLKAAHEPMQISVQTFVRLLDFVGQFPHYFVGSNADLPIVGGSILSHDHFQGGHYEFAMANARVTSEKQLSDGVGLQTLHWPMSVIRLVGSDPAAILGWSKVVLDAWRGYSDESVDVLSHTDDTPHNTITPIARMRNGMYELDMVLRNNRTSDEHPLGIFHPHAPLHHIKKENIGLIEVMGLAVLPDRLAISLRKLAQCLRGELSINEDASLEIHRTWFEQIAAQYDPLQDAESFIQMEIGRVFEQVLCDAGVFKQTPEGQAALNRFVQSLSKA